VVLHRGSAGDPVRDLHQRLAAAGHAVPPEEIASFGECTEKCVIDFQRSRGLRVDGICGPQTWAALVESGFSLGDRLLYLRHPMLRGDDIGELQRRLNALGFDAGREDGIFGPDTEAALRQFQMNAGVTSDGVAGPATQQALDHLDALAAGSVASVRELDVLRHQTHSLTGRRIFVAVDPGLDALGELVRRGLATSGALVVIDASGCDDSALARSANAFAADLAIVLRAGDVPGERCSFFATRTFRSEAGFLLAGRIEEELSAVLGPAGPPSGKSYDVLRETRMAAVVCSPVCSGDVDGMGRLAGRAGEVAAAIVRGTRSWTEAPLDAVR